MEEDEGCACTDVSVLIRRRLHGCCGEEAVAELGAGKHLSPDDVSWSHVTSFRLTSDHHPFPPGPSSPGYSHLRLLPDEEAFLWTL
jgi:hypothetical protein